MSDEQEARPAVAGEDLRGAEEEPTAVGTDLGDDVDGTGGRDGEPVDRGPEAVAEHDAEIDAELDRLDDGGALVGAARGARSEALPFMMSTREHFAALDVVGPTGDARVDAATARLDEVPDLPTSDHVEVYDDVLRRLHDALSDADVR